MIGGTKELEFYVLKCEGVSRKYLNMMCLVGIFVFGWLLATCFDLLGKKNFGWFYVAPIITLIVVAQQLHSLVGLWSPAIYLLGWLHVNMVLSRYQVQARMRMKGIDQLSSAEQTADILLEKGLLQAKVLGAWDAAATTFNQALQKSDGDAQLWNLAGSILFLRNRYSAAKPLFDRALAGAVGEGLIELVQKNQSAVEKRLAEEQNPAAAK